MIPIAIAVAVAVGAVIWIARRPKGTLAKCPTCDMVLVPAASTNDAVLMCPPCGAYLEVSGDQLLPITESFVARTPAFGCALPTTELHWPTGCCMCGQAGTRTVDATLFEKNDAGLLAQVAVRSASLGVLKAVDVTTFSVSVPHCSQHADGAMLTRTEGPAYRATGTSIGDRML